ncbi:MAG: hypothetical protein ACAI35_09690 [Candidatus Methylacidiphilales bacterium]
MKFQIFFSWLDSERKAIALRGCSDFGKIAPGMHIKCHKLESFSNSFIVSLVEDDLPDKLKELQAYDNQLYWTYMTLETCSSLFNIMRERAFESFQNNDVNTLIVKDNYIGNAIEYCALPAPVYSIKLTIGGIGEREHDKDKERRFLYHQTVYFPCDDPYLEANFMSIFKENSQISLSKDS